MFEEKYNDEEIPEIFTISFNGCKMEINLYIIAQVKIWFDIQIIDPTIEILEYVKQAYCIVLDTQKGIIPTTTDSDIINYFVNTWILKNINSKDDLLFIQEEIEKLKFEIEKTLSKRKIEQETEKELIALEISKLDKEKERIKAFAKEILLSNPQELTRVQVDFFSKLQYSTRYREILGDWLYDLICNEDVAKVCFLLNKYSFELKAVFLIETINHNDTIRAEKLIDMMVETSNYDDYLLRNSWEMNSKNTMKTFLRHIYLKNDSNIKENPVTHKTKQYSITLVEKIIPYLKDESKKELLGGLAAIDESGKYTKLYIDNLLIDVVSYAKKPRPRGFGKSINRVTFEIHESFKILPLINRMDILIKVLNILKHAGEDLKPVNYKSYMEKLSLLLDKNIFEEVKGAMNINTINQ